MPDRGPTDEPTTDRTANRVTRRALSRRSVVGTAAWSAPAIVLASAAPSVASSGGNSVDIAVATTSTTGGKVIYTVTLTNNTASPMDPMRVQWTFFRTGPAFSLIGQTSDTFAPESFPEVDGADVSIVYLKVTPLPTGISYHQFEWDFDPDDYTATVTVSAQPGSGTGGQAATTYQTT